MNSSDKNEDIQSRKPNNIDEFIYYALIYIGFNLIVYLIKQLSGIFSQKKVRNKNKIRKIMN